MTMMFTEQRSEGLLVDPRVLLIDPDATGVRALAGSLERSGMQVASAHDAATGLTLMSRLSPDIVLVSLRLADVNSVTLVGQLVERRDCGVIVLAGPEDEAARIASLELGADDFLAMPASARDLVMRVRAVHRRVNKRSAAAAPPANDAILSVGPIRINLQHRSVHTQEGSRLNLTSAEFTALETLARAGGTAVSRDLLSEAALRRPWRAEDRSVDQLVFNLRQKLPADADGGVLIQSIRGSGYWMRAPDRPARRHADPVWPMVEQVRPAQDYWLAKSA